MGHIMLTVLRGIYSLAYGFYWYIEGMERKKVRVGDRAIKMHEGRGLLGRYLIAKNIRSHQETKFAVFNFFREQV